VDRERLKVPRQKFRVVDGRPIGEIPTDRIALSFVHPTERIDVPISAIRWIEPRACKFYNWGKKSIVSRLPFVEICLAPYIRERIYRLTKTIVGEAIEIVIDGKCIIKPVIREPLGVHQSLSISEIYYEDAVALADRLRARWSETGPKLV
jgi:hypothetical protein